MTRAFSSFASATAVLLACAAATAAAAPGWTPAQNIGSGYAPSIAVDPDGKVVVVYGAPPACFFCGGPVEALVRPPGSGWGLPEHIGEAGYRGLSSETTTGIDDHGAAVTLWEPGDSGQGGGNLWSSSRPVGGPWSAPLDLSDPSYVDGHDLAVDPDGKAIAVWSVEPFTLDGDHVLAAVRPAGGSWQQPQELANPELAGRLGVAIDPQGRAIAIWQEGEDSDALNVVASLRPAGGQWSAGKPLTDSAVLDPAVGVDGAGSITVAWIRDGLPQVVERPIASGTWQPSRSLSLFSDASSLKLAVGRDGTSAVIWIREGHPYAAVRSAAGAWTGAEKLAGSEAGNPAVTVTRTGTVAAAWQTDDGAVEAAVHPPGGGWSAAGGIGSGFAPRLAADAAGNVVAVWADDATALHTAAYDVTPPRISGLQVPATATVGTPIAVSMAAPSDLWSAVPGVGWDFGDGATAGGTGASHAYAAPGVYTVTARAQDALGNLATQTRQVTVSAPPPPSPGVTFDPSGPPGTVGTLGGVVVVAIPGAGSGSTPAPPKGGRTVRRKAVTLAVVLPAAIRAGQKGVISVRLNRPVRGALVRVQLRTGVRYRTIAQGRVSGRRIPVALAFAKPGRYLMRIQIREAGAKLVSRVTPVVVRR